MRIEIITQNNCPKCLYIKRELLSPTIDRTYITFKDWSAYTQSFLEAYDITHTPTIIMWDDNAKVDIIEKGMTIKNIAERIKAHTGVEIRKVY